MTATSVAVDQTKALENVHMAVVCVKWPIRPKTGPEDPPRTNPGTHTNGSPNSTARQAASGLSFLRLLPFRSPACMEIANGNVCTALLLSRHGARGVDGDDVLTERPPPPPCGQDDVYKTDFSDGSMPPLHSQARKGNFKAVHNLLLLDL